jgi:hypothetical protein
MTAMKFRLLHGTFSHNGRRYRRDDIILSNVDLAKQFTGVFARELDRSIPATVGVLEKKVAPSAVEDVKPTPATVPDEDGEDGDEDAPTPSYGDDVTADFPAAAKPGVQVFTKDGKYTVVSGQEVVVQEVTKVAAKAAVKNLE